MLNQFFESMDGTIKVQITLIKPFDTPVSNWLALHLLLLFYTLVGLKINRLIGKVGRVFASCLGDMGSIPGRVIPKTLKMVLDASLLNIQQYKVRSKGKVEQPKERSSTLPSTLV